MREERRVVTALFVDVVGSSSLVQRLDPEDARELIGEIIACAVTAVEAFGGTVKDLAGDGVLALFGAPVAHEDDAERAVRAGLRVVDDTADLAASSDGEAIAVRVGIDTGLAVLGPVGASGRVEYGAVGDAVNIAARLQAHAAPQSVLVAEGTRKGIESLFDWGREQRVTIKDRSEPVAAWPAASCLDSRRQHGAATPSVLVGRVPELMQLRGAMERMLDGGGGVVVISGEPGVGKSRLLVEGRRIFDELVGGLSGWIEGRCISYGGETPYLPYRELLRDCLGVTTDVSHREMRAALRKHAGSLCGCDFPDLEPFLSRVLGIQLDADEKALFEGLSPEQIREGVMGAMTEVLQKLALRSPLVVALEDMHWADTSSISLSERLLHVASETPMCMIVTSRPDPDTAGWKFASEIVARSEVNSREVVVRSLDDGKDGELLRALVGAEVLPTSLQEAVLSAADGNPFYLEEIVHSLQEAGALVRDGSAWRYDHDVTVEVPPTVERLILTRIDRLGGSAHSVICAAATIGRRFSVPVLESVAHCAEDLSLVLADLTRRDFVLPAGEQTWTFKHVLIQETVYRSMLKKRRRELHRSIGETLEPLLPGREDELAAVLGNHFAHAEAPGKAGRYLKIAAERAQRSYANAEAISLFGMALSQAHLLDMEPDGSGSEMLVELSESLGDVLVVVGRYRDAAASFHRALQVLTVDDVIPRSRLLRKIAVTHVVQREYDDALVKLEEAEETLQNESDASTRRWREWLDIRAVRSDIAYFTGDFLGQERILVETRPLLETHGTPLQRADVFRQLAFAANTRTHFVVSDETLEWAQAWLSATEDLNDPSASARANFYVGLSLLWHGDIGEAEDHLASALAFAEQSGDVLVQSRCLIYLAVSARLRGAVEETRNLLDRSDIAAKASGLLEYVAMGEAIRCWVAWRERNEEALTRHGTAALELWRSLPIRYPFCWMALWPLIANALDHGQTAKALEYAHELLDQSQQPPPEPVEALLRRCFNSSPDEDPSASAPTLVAALHAAESYGLL